MAIGGWIILLALSAVVATVGQYLFLRKDRGPRDYDWVYMAGGGLIGGFTAHLWYPTGPTFGGLYLLPMLGGVVVGAVLLEVVYRLFLRPRRT
jgi:hypothetical protein